MDQYADSSLIELAKGGDQAAFAELYSRYFDPVYDFVARMTRNPDEAADIAQDTFLKAMNALGGLQKGASFKSWVFTIARNTALNRIEKSSRTRPLTFEGEDGEEVRMDVIDTDRFSDPEEAAQASAVASLVWEAAAGLDPRQLSLLDLHLRQGLDSGEIADVLGVTKNNGYVMLNRLKKAVEDSIGAFIMLKSGRQYCEDLDFVLSRADIQGMSPEARKLVERHVAQCPDCEERKRKLAPLAAFAAFGAVPCPIGAKAHILEGLLKQWPGPAASTGGAGIEGVPGHYRANDRLRTAGPKDGWAGKAKFLVPGLGGLAALLFGALFIPASPLAVINAGEDDGVAVDPGDPSVEGTPTPPRASATAPVIVPPSSTPAGTASPSSTVQQGQAGVTATPTNTSTPVPTPGPGTPTFTPSPTATRTNTPTQTATATPPTVTPATVTPTACVPSLSPAVPHINIAPGAASTLTVLNGAACGTTFSASPQGAAWLNVSGGGTIGPFDDAIVNLSVDESDLPAGPGTYIGSVIIVWSGGGFTVTVETTKLAPPNTPPVISSASGQCTTPPQWSASVTDSDGGVVSVVIRYTNNDGAPAEVPLANTGGPNWAGAGGSGARGGSNYLAVATDNLGASSSLPFTPLRCE